MFFKVDEGISVETGNFLPKNGYVWIWRIFYRKIRIFMDMDPAERSGVEWVSEFCPVKGSTVPPFSEKMRVPLRAVLALAGHQHTPKLAVAASNK